jgi:hypothetical protein
MGPCYLSTDINQAYARISRLANTLAFDEISSKTSLLVWLAAGVVYPVSIGLASPGLPASAYVHFLASLALCGLIATAYPFFFVAFLSVRVLYPALVRREASGVEDVIELRELSRLLGRYLLLAALVPLVAVLVLVVTGSESRWALTVPSVGGLVGVSAVFLLFRALQIDLDALARVLCPDEVSLPRHSS